MIFLGEFLHCDYKFFWRNWQKFVLIAWIREKNAQIIEKFDKVYKSQNWKKQEIEKEKAGTEEYMCAL